MARLELSLLGPLEVTLDGEPVTQFESNKVRALLVYLAVEADRPHCRDALATLLWPDRFSRAARVNLRTALANLRTAIGDRDADPPFLLITREAIQFNSTSNCWVDVARFRALVESHRPGDPSTQQLEEAVGLYRGPFLEGFSLRGSAAFDDWCLLTQEHLHRQALTALQRLAREVERGGNLRRACEVVRRQVELDPWQEEAHRELMRLLVLAGQRNAALAQYEACRETLMEGLGVEPEEETTLLYERIRDGEELPSPSRGPPHNLPLPLPGLIGREDELAEIQARLQDTECRLLTVIGPGGIGKSRLALQAAADQRRQFPQGVYLINLAPVSSAELLASTIMETMNLPLHGSMHPNTQLLNALREKALLLLLDNFEHLLAGTPLITQILRAARAVKLLVTSRERLNLRDEWLLPLQGLHYPEEHIIGVAEDGPGRSEDVAADDGHVALLQRYSAVRLFEQCARRVQPGFSLAEAGPWSVARICQLVEGMPLAIELAAPWVRMMSCQEIAQHIESDLGLLASSLRDMPQRHRSMRAVFDHSWKLLTVEEREVLAKLSVFRGGFRREAAEAMAGGSREVLSALVDSSWLWTAPSGRHEMHELVRQYASEQLEGDQQNSDRVRDRHSEYYAAFLDEREARLKGQGQAEALQEILTDMDNVRAAWSWAIGRGDVETLGKSVESLCLVSQRRGWYRGMDQTLDRAAIKLREKLDVYRSDQQALLSDETAIVLAQVLSWQALHRSRFGWADGALALLEESQTLLHDVGRSPRQQKASAWAKVTLAWVLSGRATDRRRANRLLQEALSEAIGVGDQWSRTFSAWCLGTNLYFSGQYVRAEGYLQQAIAMGDQSGDQWWKLWCRDMLGRVLCAKGEYRTAENLAEENLQLSQELGDRVGVSASLIKLGETAIALGKYDLARQHYQDSLAIASELGDPHIEVDSLVGLATVVSAVEEHIEAKQLLEAGLGMAQEVGLWRRLTALVGLGHTTFALGEICRSRGCFCEALELAASTELMPQALSALVGMAHLVAYEAEPERALELLALALQHPAALQVTRDRAQRLLSQLESVLSPVAFAEATARAQGRDLDDVMAEVLGTC